MLSKTHPAFVILILAILLSGCSPHMNLVMGDSSKMPKNAVEFHEYLVKSNKLEDPKVIPVNFETVAERLQQAASQCYRFEISTVRRSGSEMHADSFTGKVTHLSNDQLFFSMQTKGLRGSETVFLDGKGTMPPDGLFMYGVEFTQVDKDHTRAKSFAPWGWGSTVDNVVKVAEGKYENGCPDKSDIFPGAS